MVFPGGLRLPQVAPLSLLRQTTKLDAGAVPLTLGEKVNTTVYGVGGKLADGVTCTIEPITAVRVPHRKVATVLPFLNPTPIVPPPAGRWAVTVVSCVGSCQVQVVPVAQRWSTTSKVLLSCAIP